MQAGIVQIKSSLKAGGFALILLVLLHPAQAQWGDGVELVSHSLIWGPFHDVEVAGNVAYCAMGYGLALLEVSNPSQIQLYSDYGVPGRTEGLCQEGNYVYMASGSAGVYILNVSNPSAPTYVGGLSLPGYAYEAVKGGDFLYVAAGASGVRILNVSQPETPQEVAALSVSDWALDVYLEDSLLYVAAQSAGLKVVNVRNPYQPQIIGGYNTEGSAQGVTKSDSLLYLSDGANGVVILNVATPTQPALVGQWLTTTGIVHEAKINGAYLYVAGGDIGVLVLNVSNPHTPNQVGSYNSPGIAWSLSLSNQTLFLADDTQGLRTLSLVNPIIPAPLDHYSHPGEVVSVWVGENHAYCARGYLRKMTILDVSDPALPQEISQVDYHDPVVELNVQGEVCYTAQLTGGVGMTDVSDPAQPHFLQRLNTIGETYDMFAQLPLVYVADGSEGLVFLALSPDTAWHLQTPGSARSLLKRNDTMYVSQWDAGVALVDVSPPTQPQILAQYDTPGLAHRCAVFGNYIYVADDFEGLTVLQNGVAVGHYPTEGDLWDVAVSGTYAYLAAGTDGLIVLDITNTSAPVYAGSYRTPGVAQRIFLEGEYIYVADQFDLGVYRFTGSGVAPVLPSIPLEFSVSVHPNPFNASAVISYELRVASFVNLRVYDIAGREVATIVEGRRGAGVHRATFDGSALPSGLYFVHIRAGEHTAVRKIALVK